MVEKKGRCCWITRMVSTADSDSTSAPLAVFLDYNPSSSSAFFSPPYNFNFKVNAMNLYSFMKSASKISTWSTSSILWKTAQPLVFLIDWSSDLYPRINLALCNGAIPSRWNKSLVKSMDFSDWITGSTANPPPFLQSSACFEQIVQMAKTSDGKKWFRNNFSSRGRLHNVETNMDHRGQIYWT